jgi:hypothetical protein
MLNKVSDYFEQGGWERSDTNLFLGVNFDLVIRKKWAKIPWHIVFKHIPILEENLISEWDENFTRLIDELKKMKWKPKLFLVVFLVDQIPDHISKTINEDEGGIFSDTHRAGSFRITPFIADKSQKALYGRIPKIPIPAKKFSKEIIDFFTAQMNYSHTYMTLHGMGCGVNSIRRYPFICRITQWNLGNSTHSNWDSELYIPKEISFYCQWDRVTTCRDPKPLRSNRPGCPDEWYGLVFWPIRSSTDILGDQRKPKISPV